MCPSAEGQRGETLVELLVALSILGLAVVVILGALGTSIRLSDVHRKHATSETLLVTAAEGIKNRQTAYLPLAGCPGHGTYSMPPATSGYAVSITSVAFWNGSTSSGYSTTCPGTDPGVQLVTVRA